MLLNVDISDCEKGSCEKATVNISLNDEGIEILQRILSRLVADGEHEHMHLMTRAWGAGEFDLTDKAIEPTSTLVNHLCIRYMPEERR